jgi:hypothetical protein
MLRGQGEQKLGDDLNRFTFGFGDAGRVLGQLLDAFPLQVAARVVDVSPSFAVGEDGHATCRQHLHHERGTGTGKP